MLDGRKIYWKVLVGILEDGVIVDALIVIFGKSIVEVVGWKRGMDK